MPQFKPLFNGSEMNHWGKKKVSLIVRAMIKSMTLWKLISELRLKIAGTGHYSPILHPGQVSLIDTVIVFLLSASTALQSLLT